MIVHVRFIISDYCTNKLSYYQTYISFWQPLLNNEMNCLSWQFNYTMDKDLATCYPVSHVIDTTMGYFCQYGVTSVVSYILYCARVLR